MPTEPTREQMEAARELARLGHRSPCPSHYGRDCNCDFVNDAAKILATLLAERDQAAERRGFERAREAVKAAVQAKLDQLRGLDKGLKEREEWVPVRVLKDVAASVKALRFDEPGPAKEGESDG